MLGGVVGATADLADSFVMSVLGALVLAPIALNPGLEWLGSVLLGVVACGLLGAIPAVFVIRLGRDNPVTGFLVATLISIAVTIAGVVAALVTRRAGDRTAARPAAGSRRRGGRSLGAGFVAEWFTSDHFKTVKEIARQSLIGPSTLVIGGIAAGMRAAAFSATALTTGFVAAYLAGTWAWPEEEVVWGWLWPRWAPR